jgi:hypothetical protein
MPVIAQEAKTVDSLFQQLTEGLRQSGIHHGSSHGISESEVSDAFGRYRIWAGNIGAFQPIETKSSLAYRIRDAPKIEAQITELLNDVAESLDDGKESSFIYKKFLIVTFIACQIVSNVRENRTATLGSKTESLDPAYQDENTQQDKTGSDSEEETSEVREILDSISDAVKNLLRLSIIVRNNTHRDRYSRAASAAMESPFDEHFDIDHVRHKFPELEKSNREWLVHRLGKSITQRRQYLRYCREHHAKISKDVITDEQSSLTANKPIIPTVTRLAPVAKSENSKPTSTLAPTQASTLVLTLGQSLEEEGTEENQSQTSYAISTEEENSISKLSVVALDEISKQEKYFECPYCWQIQAISNQKAWK